MDTITLQELASFLQELANEREMDGPEGTEINITISPAGLLIHGDTQQAQILMETINIMKYGRQ